MAAAGAGNSQAAVTVKGKQWSVAAPSTLAFTLCFAVRTLVALIGVPIRRALDADATQPAILTASPVLPSPLIRPPLGMWTDGYVGRLALFLLMVATIMPIWVLSSATEFRLLVVLGLFGGLAGGSFSIGTSYAARWFVRGSRSMPVGVCGAGGSGAAFSKSFAPALRAACVCCSGPARCKRRNEVGAPGRATAVSAVLAAALRQLHGRATPDRRPGAALTATA